MATDQYENPFFTLGADGTIVFTVEAIRLWKPYFSKMGIDIGQIHTLAQYLDARRKAAPYFNEHLLEIAQGDPGQPRTMERQALIAIAEGDKKRFSKLLNKLDMRNKMGLRIVK